MDCSSNLLIYSINVTMYLINITTIANPTQISQITQPSNINDIKLCKPFIIILSNGNISQYDIDLNLSISTLSIGISTDNIRIDLVGV
jgi:hypothetical protein